MQYARCSKIFVPCLLGDADPGAYADACRRNLKYIFSYMICLCKRWKRTRTSYTIIIYSQGRRVTRTPTLRTNSIWRKFIFLDLSQGVCTTRRRHIRVRRNKRPNNIHKPKQQFSCWMNTYMYVCIMYLCYTNMYIYLWKCRTTLARKFLEPNTYVYVARRASLQKRVICMG